MSILTMRIGGPARAFGRLRRSGALGLALAVLASPVGAETIRDALVRTYRSNPQLAAERARQRGDDENVPRALSGYFPTVGAAGDVGLNYQRQSPGGRGQFSTPLNLGLTVNQPIYDGGRTTASVRSAESAVLGGRATLRGVEQDVLLAAATAYMDVLRDAALVELQRNNVEALKETLRIARVRFEKGAVSATDPAQAEARVARGQADFVLAQSNLNASTATYRQVTGAAPRGLMFPNEEGLAPRSLKAALGRAFDHHPAIRSAAHLVDAAQSDVRVAGSDLLPTVSAQGTLTRTFDRSVRDRDGSSASDLSGGTGQDDGFGNGLGGDSGFGSAGTGRSGGGSFTAGAALQANVPIYDGGAASARVRQAKETLGQRRIELEAARDGVRSDLRTAWGLLEAARSTIPARETAVAAAEIALEGVTREASEGQRTTLDVLNAQQEVVNARTNLLAARRDRVVAIYGVLAAAGELSAARLGLPGPRYRPEQHYEQVKDLRWGVRTPDGR